VYNGEGDAVMMLDDLDASREGMIKDEKDATQAGSDTFVEIVLSFLGNPRTLFRKIGVEAFSIFVAEIGSVGLQSLTDILDTEESLEGQRELFNQDHDDDDDAAEGQSSGDSDNDSDVEMVDGEEQDSEDAGSGTLDSDDMDDEDDNGSDNDNNSEDDAELVQFNNMLAMTLQTSKPGMNSDVAEDTSDGSDMDDDQMMALDQQLSKIFQQRNQITSKKKDREGAKQNMVQFKSRVLDLLAIYLEKQYSNPLTLDLLLPILRRTRASANKQLAEKASKLLKAHLGAQKKQKAPLPRPVDVDAVLAVLRAIHEEAKLGGGAKMHADTCSSVSLFLVKVLIGLDRGNYSGVVDIYAETQKQWFMDRKSPLQPALFLSFQNWSLNARQQSK
jgi:DNA polymerase phi